MKEYKQNPFEIDFDSYIWWSEKVVRNYSKSL